VSDLIPRVELAERCADVLDAAWQPEGYTSPNLGTYPWMWLWDSCFHAQVWHAVGDDGRALTELESVFEWQTADGFVPHMGYQRDPDAAIELWGRPGSSTVTQPPMYAHTARYLADRAVAVPGELVDRMRAGLEFLWTLRRRADGLVHIVHPWESGCDDAHRWNSFTESPWTREGWNRSRDRMMDGIRLSPYGSSVANPSFDVGSASFNALVAFNLAEFAELTGETVWVERSQELAAALDRQWVGGPSTWADTGGHSSASAPTAESALGVLVRPERFDEVWAQLTDPVSFGAPHGPAGADRRTTGYDPHSYWRGATWPQINYLLWVAAAERPEARETLARATITAAVESGFAEFWDSADAAGGGAAPQSWTTLALLMHPG